MKDYERYQAARDYLRFRWSSPDNCLAEAEALRESATTYVWGWQDAHGEMDSRDAYRFGLAFGTVAALYAGELIWMRPNIAHAFKSWRENGAIVEDYFAGVPTALDHIEAPRVEVEVL